MNLKVLFRRMSEDGTTNKEPFYAHTFKVEEPTIIREMEVSVDEELLMVQPFFFHPNARVYHTVCSRLYPNDEVFIAVIKEAMEKLTEGRSEGEDYVEGVLDAIKILMRYVERVRVVEW